MRFQAMHDPRRSDGIDAVSRDRRRRAGSGAVIVKLGRVIVAPDLLAVADMPADDGLAIPVLHRRIEPVADYDDGGIARADWFLPKDRGTGLGPGPGQTFFTGKTVRVRTAPLRPVRGVRIRGIDKV